MTEQIYEFVTVERTDGPFTVPGEIVEILENDPHSKKKFTALVKISQDVVEEETSEEEEIDVSSFDGVGETVATRLKAAGYKYPSDFSDVTPEEVAEEVKGLGPGRAENIFEEAAKQNNDS